MDRHDRQPEAEAKEEIATVSATASPVNTYGIAIFFIIVVQAALVVGLNAYQRAQANKLDTQIADTRKTLASPENSLTNTQIDDILNGQQALQVAIANKIQWSKFYGQLNAITPKNVRLTNISINQNGTIKADGETASLTALAQALVAWQKGVGEVPTPFQSVTLSTNNFSLQGSNRIVVFSINGQINTGNFK